MSQKVWLLLLYTKDLHGVDLDWTLDLGLDLGPNDRVQTNIEQGVPDQDEHGFGNDEQMPITPPQKVSDVVIPQKRKRKPKRKVDLYDGSVSILSI
jgi:hypothetical protein